MFAVVIYIRYNVINGAIDMSVNPVIIIPGICQSNLVAYDANGNKIKNAWPVEIDQKAIINDLKGSLMKMMLFRTDGGFSDKVAAIVDDVTELWAVNPDGSKKYSIKPVSYRKSLNECTANEKKFILGNFPFLSLGEKIGEDKIFYFAYDFLGDIGNIAAELDEFIGFVKQKTACEKVNLVAYSTGGAIIKAYLKDYAVKCDCEKIVDIAGVLDGSSLVADVFENKVNFNDPMSIIASVGEDVSSIAPMMGMLPVDVIEKVINKSLSALRNKVLDNCTTAWALIPAGRFEQIFSACKKNDVFAEKVSALHEYSVNFTAEAEKLESSGMKFYQLCGTDKKLPVFAESYDICSDGMVDTSSASLGGKFPETTWYFSNQDHVEVLQNDVIMSLAEKILSGEAEDVASSGYPAKNGSRNTKTLRTKLIPKAKSIIETTADVAKKAQLEECVAEYERILAETVIENNSNIKQLESKLKLLIKD